MMGGGEKGGKSVARSTRAQEGTEISPLDYDADSSPPPFVLQQQGYEIGGVWPREEERRITIMKRRDLGANFPPKKWSTRI